MSKKLIILIMIVSLFVSFTSLSAEVEKIKASAQSTTIDAQVGSLINIPVNIDVTALPEKLGSFTAVLTWNPSDLEFVSYAGGSTAEFSSPVVNDKEVEKGKLRIANANPNGAEGLVNIFNATFKLVGDANISSLVKLEFTAMSAAKTFTDLLPNVEVVEHQVNGTFVPTEYKISAYPNPFNPETQISYHVPEAGDVKIEIFNVLGQKIRVLVNQHQEAGAYNATWNGTSQKNMQMPSGTYFLKVSAKNYSNTIKLMLLQ